MNDDQTPSQVPLTPVQDPAMSHSDQSQPAPAADPASSPVVDDLVTQGQAIQDLFAQNDAATASVQSSPADDLFGDQPQPQPASDSSQKSPLDILEEILKKEEKNATPEVPVDAGPSPDDLARIKVLEEQERVLIEEQRMKMHAEVNSDEQKQRDQIRLQQAAANQGSDPYEIRQIERKKITR